MDQLVTLPRVIVEVNGAPLSPNEAGALVAVRVHQRLSLPTLGELAFLDPEGQVAEATTLSPGSSLRIAIEEEHAPLFVGEVTAVDYEYGPSHAREVRVRGYDLLHRLRKRQPVGAHVQVTVVELVRALVSDLGLAVEAVETGPIWQKLVQYRQSDLELMTEVADRCGLYLALRDEILHLLTLEGLGDPVPLMLGESLLEARVVVNADPACRSVKASGWNPWRAQPHQGHANEPRLGRRVATEVPPTRVGGSGERNLVDETIQDDGQAEIMAQAELDRRVAGEVVLWGVAEGNPFLQPGTPITVAGVGDSLAGRYVLTAVTHTIDHRKGFVSEIDTAPPPPRPRQRNTLSTLGHVTRVDDPEELGRIRVSLPNYDDVETDWLEVVLPAAGADKGIVALPDVGDRVFVLLGRDDPAQGVVLGGLYGVQAPPDTGVKDGAVRRYNFRTPGGQHVRLDDDKKTVHIRDSGGNYVQLSPGKARLENSDGSYIELAREKVMIHAEVGLEIEAPGQSVVIRGQSIDFERA